MVRLEFPEDIPSLPIGAEARHQLALSVREGLNNIVRHASATEVVLGLSIADGRLTVQIRDNGKGFKPEVAPGHGLENMTVRMEQAGGLFEIASKPGAGTVLNFRLPLEKSTRPAAKTSPAAAPAAVPRASQPLG
jgi:signal transduction histidine kinase